MQRSAPLGIVKDYVIRT